MPLPCDAVQPWGEVTSGGAGTFALSRISGATASGTVVVTNDPALLPAGTVVLERLLYGVARITTGHGTTWTICGGKGADTAPQAFRDTNPCGA